MASFVLVGWLSSFDSRASGMIRWPEKPPKPLAVQAQELKMVVVPLGTALASLVSSIEFAGELAESPYLARQLSVFSCQACLGIPLAVGL